MICQMIGIFLYCGQATQPLAMFPQSNNLPTAEMADQMVRSRDNSFAARSTPYDVCPIGMRKMDAQCLYNIGYRYDLEAQCFRGCAR